MLKYARARQSKTYRYLFTRGRDGAIAEPTHGDELQYVFGTLAGEHKGTHKQFDGADVRVSGQIQNAWVNFAKTGDPNGGDIPKWPRYDVETEPYLDFGTRTVIGHGGRAAQLDFLTAFYGNRH